MKVLTTKAEKPKILITGGTGFIGGRINTLLQKEGYQTILFRGEITKEEDWKQSLKGGVDSIIHVAGIRTETEEDLEVNTGSAQLLADILYHKFAFPHTLIYISSQAVYFGQTPPFNEEMIVSPTGFYAKSKLDVEKILLKAGKDLNIRTVVFRPSTVLGQGVRGGNKMSGPLAIWTQNALEGKPIIVNQDGKQTRDYIHVDDVASAVVLGLKNNKIEGIFNCGGGKSITLFEFANWVKEANKSKSGIIINGGEASATDPTEMFSDTAKLEKFGWKPYKTAKDAIFEGI